MSEDEVFSTQWMFQYNPDWYDLERAIERSLIEDWRCYWNRTRIRVGQRVYFMRSGGKRGKEYRAITAVGRIAASVHERPNEPDEHRRYRVNVVHDYLVMPTLTHDEMLRDDIH
jgi:hypothetical protein